MEDENNQVPKEHQLKCEHCGAIIDLRDLSQGLSHGVYNEALRIYECKPVEAEYGASRKIGDSVEWDKNMKPRYLN